MCYTGQWKQVKQMKVEPLSDKAGRCSQYPELAALVTVEATGSSYSKSNSQVTSLSKRNMQSFYNPSFTVKHLRHLNFTWSCRGQLLQTNSCFIPHMWMGGSSYTGGPKPYLISLYQNSMYGHTTARYSGYTMSDV